MDDGSNTTYAKMVDGLSCIGWEHDCNSEFSYINTDTNLVTLETNLIQQMTNKGFNFVKNEAFTSFLNQYMS